MNRIPFNLIVEDHYFAQIHFCEFKFLIIAFVKTKLMKKKIFFVGNSILISASQLFKA